MPAKKPFVIEKPCLLVVEGEAVLRFFDGLTRHMGIQTAQLHSFGGRNELRPLLRGLAATEGFSKLRMLAVVVDAEIDAAGSIQSTRDALRWHDFKASDVPCELAGSSPATCYFVLPNNRDAGMIEDLCLESVADDPRMGCVDNYFDCVSSIAAVPSNLSKARAHCYLSSMTEPEKRVGEAAQANYWPWDSPAFDAVKAFVKLVTPG